MAGEHDLDEIQTPDPASRENLGEVQETLREIVPLRSENEHLARENCRALLRLKAMVERALEVKRSE